VNFTDKIVNCTTYLSYAVSSSLFYRATCYKLKVPYKMTEMIPTKFGPPRIQIPMYLVST